MRLSVTLLDLFSLTGTRAALVIALTSTLVSACGTLICMDGPCDAVMADAYSKSVFTPNAFSESRGAEEIAADIWECKATGEAESIRLLTELRAFDPYLDEYAARRAKTDSIGDSVGRTAANTDVDTSGSGVRVSSGSSSRFEEDMAGAAGSLAALILLDDGYDPSKEPIIDLESDLEDTDTFVRFTNICLRQKGYQVDEHARDSTGTAYLNPEQLRVVIRTSDCVDIVMYERPLPDGGLPGPVTAKDCTPGVIQVAASGGVMAAVSWPHTDLPEPLAGIDDRAALDEYLDVEPACVWSRPGYQVCSWRELGKRNKFGMREKSYKTLARYIDTGSHINVICELPNKGLISTPDSCQIYPRETKGKPNKKDGASDAAFISIRAANGIGAVSRLVGDGPVACKTVGDGIQECRWYADKEVQGFRIVGTAAKTKKPSNLSCLFSMNDGATQPKSCMAFRAP